MIKFKDKKTGQIKFPKRVFQKADKNLYYVQFPNNDKIYSFNKKNVEFLSGEEEIEYLEKKEGILPHRCTWSERTSGSKADESVS